MTRVSLFQANIYFSLSIVFVGSKHIVQNDCECDHKMDAGSDEPGDWQTGM